MLPRHCSFFWEADLSNIFEERVRMFCRDEPIPDHREFPGIRPRLESYGFPQHLVDCADMDMRAAAIRHELHNGLNESRVINYKVPWTSSDAIAPGSLDLIFSQAAFEHVDELEETYVAMYSWLRPGGFASHVIDFSAHHFSRFWNGHWAYNDWEWSLVRGRREFLLNRQPLSVHLLFATRAGFEILQLDKEYGEGGLDRHCLATRFQMLSDEDLRTRVAILVLRKLTSTT